MDRSKGVSSGSSSNIGDRNAAFSAYGRPDHEKDGVAAGDDSTEISIFEAQKYFNETIIDAQKVTNNTKNNNPATAINYRAVSSHLGNNVTVDNMEQPPRFSWASSSVHDEYSSINMARNNYRARSFHAAATPTASSEASWNSQTGLLSHPAGTVAVSLRSPTQHHDQKKSRGMAPSPSSSSSSPRVRWFSFPRRCPCSSKKSVRVEDKMSSSQQPAKTTSPSHFPAAAPRSISLDLRNQTPMSKSVMAAREDQHVMWGEERRRRWEEQLTIKLPSAGNPHNRLCRPLPAAGELQPQHTNAFSFPILKLNGRGTSWSSSSPVLKLQQPATLKQEPALVREGAEPLTTSVEEQSSTTISIRKPTITDHSSTTGLTFPGSPPKSRVIMNNDDDLGSDASSDLFEIESFSASTQTTATANNYTSALYHQYNNYRRDSMEDDAPSFNAIRGLYRRRSSLDIEPMTPSSADQYCYEPSEASIDWSVTTAEGLDRPSTSSEADYHHDELEKTSRSRRSSSAGGSYGLLSCRWEKAVSVGPNPVRLVSSGGAAVAVGDEVMKHVGSRPPLPNKPRSSHLSNPHATSFYA
ncbi:protein PHYTOCHROME KINASE SUBSTRATE 4 [Argentina anserina]|uniref:protein PHYTOCHROME KINASE SUBSTRATE 4 n=1 Tax=Argentina anserina TaxID=57926 RepID=UPI0021766F4A|nr:protein PHYTOCHROME KINASE SUBSTRATE 4 [Potentilla anserina]